MAMPSGAAHSSFFIWLICKICSDLTLISWHLDNDIMTSPAECCRFCRWRHSLVVKILPQSCTCNTTWPKLEMPEPKPRTTDVDLRKVMTEKPTNSTHLSLCWSGLTSSQFRRKIGEKKTELFRRLIHRSIYKWSDLSDYHRLLWQRYLLRHYDAAGTQPIKRTSINLIIIRFLLRF